MKVADFHQRRADAYSWLKDEFTEAFFKDTRKHIRTPAGLHPVTRLSDVVVEFLGVGDELDLLGPMLHVLVNAANGCDPSTRLPAMAIIARLAHLYAEENADDFADELRRVPRVG